MSSSEPHPLSVVRAKEHRARLRVELDRLQGRRARAKDPATRAKLDERIRIAQIRLGRV